MDAAIKHFFLRCELPSIFLLAFALSGLSPYPFVDQCKTVMLESDGRREVRVAHAGGGIIFPFLSPSMPPKSDCSDEREYVEEGKLGIVEDYDYDYDYEANKVNVSFSISGSRGNSCDGGVGVSGGSSSPSCSSCLPNGLINSETWGPFLSEKSSSKVHIKKESIEAVDGVEGEAWGYSYGRNRSFSSSLSACFPKPMEGLHEMGPPPFLKKTFEMVEDPEWDPIVSWNQARDSFIVWDSHEFSKKMLPKYFKHGNFSSFVRQLNTYGFRKIGTDRWEFANEGFQGGNKHLLKTIKRRSRYNKQQLIATSGLNLAESGFYGELETLKKDQNALKEEILKLRQEYEESRNKLTVVAEHIRGAECKQQQMLSFLIKMVQNPSFVHQLMRKRTHKNGVDEDEFCKRRRLLPAGSLESLYQTSMASQSDLTDISLKPEVPRQIETPFQASINDKSCSFRRGHRAVDTSSAYLVTTEVENPIIDAELMVNESKFYHELEDLVRKPHDWGGHISRHIAQGCAGSMP